jgi:oxygen-dependent protoporphyrinogen oxidase
LYFTKPKTVFILGGGIAGLSAAHFLKKQNPLCKITLFEKKNRLGGFVETVYEKGCIFEKGPRTFRYDHCPYLLQLIHDLKLPILRSDPSAKKRYLWHKGKLRSMGSFLPLLIPYLFKEPFVPKSTQDESIYEFASRRFSPKIANLLFDPLTLGIYAGDIHKLSIRNCFPKLYNWEQEHGSVLKGLFHTKAEKGGLFTLANGMQSLISALEKSLDITIFLNTEAKQLDDTHILVNHECLQADQVINALPPNVPKASIWVVNLAFPNKVLSKKGFGYLIPTVEKQAVLGVIFDSCIFPSNASGTRLTVMVRPEENAPLKAALEALRNHLKISTPPEIALCHLAQDAIPQYYTNIEKPFGVSLEEAVERGFKASQSI